VNQVAGQVLLVAVERAGGLDRPLRHDGHEQIAQGHNAHHPSMVDDRSPGHLGLLQASGGNVGRGVGLEHDHLTGHGLADGSEQAVEAGRRGQRRCHGSSPPQAQGGRLPPP
jgi:hypothetical protein